MRNYGTTDLRQGSGRLGALLVAAAALLVYLNALGGGFVFDDKPLLLDNPASLRFDRLPLHFTGEEGFHKTMGRYYRPLVSVTYAVDRSLGETLFGGIDPRTFHFTNVVIHVLASLAALRLLRLLLENRAAALLAALLFAVHPIHTEAVAWISGRTDSLAALFYLTALSEFIRFSRGAGRGSLILLHVSFVAALWCKEMAVTLPAAAILLDQTACAPRVRTVRARLALIASLAAVTLLFLLLRQAALSGKEVTATMEYFHGKSPVTVLATMLQTLPQCARLLVLPKGMLYHYNGTLPYLDSLLAGRAMLSAAFVLGTMAAALLVRRRLPLVTCAILFFFASLLPVLNIVPTVSLMAERFLYIPSLSLSLLLGILLREIRPPAIRRALFLAAVASLVCCAILTVNRNRDWKSNESLYQSAEGSPGTLLSVNLGNLHFQRGEMEQAEALYLQALELKEETSRAHLNLGMVRFFRGANDLIASQQAAKEGDPDREKVLAGQAEERLDEARRHLERARALEPASPDPVYELAHLAQVRGQKAECRRLLQELEKMAPGYPGASELRQLLPR
ncbi:MAG: tetratricopeptide repeat protein [Planctomycetota bacterium]